jgi:hypothetical protein
MFTQVPGTDKIGRFLPYDFRIDEVAEQHLGRPFSGRNHVVYHAEGGYQLGASAGFQHRMGRVEEQHEKRIRSPGDLS